jgi:hypothetical protein
MNHRQSCLAVTQSTLRLQSGSTTQNITWVCLNKRNRTSYIKIHWSILAKRRLLLYTESRTSLKHKPHDLIATWKRLWQNTNFHLPISVMWMKFGSQLFKILYYFSSRRTRNIGFCQNMGARRERYSILHNECGLISPIFTFRHWNIFPLLKEDEPCWNTYSCWNSGWHKCSLLRLRHFWKFKLKYKKYHLFLNLDNRRGHYTYNPCTGNGIFSFCTPHTSHRCNNRM